MHLCPNCKKVWCADSQKYCSGDCYHEYWKQNIRPQLTAQQTRKVKVNCKNCRKEVQKHLFRFKENKYNFCSRHCAVEFRMTHRKGWREKDRTKYKSIHDKIYRMKGRATFCIDCGKNSPGRYHWANISGEYKLDPNDYEPLCPKCHFAKDMKAGGIY